MNGHPRGLPSAGAPVRARKDAVMVPEGVPQLTLSEIHRVLRPGGPLVLAEPLAAPTGARPDRAQSANIPPSRRFDHGADHRWHPQAIIRGARLQVRECRDHEPPQPLRIKVSHMGAGTAR
jgi:SAM-dependent methyltransferase